MTQRSKILDKAKKLKELADRGIGGEKENAKDMFKKWMMKHNITMDELQGHTINDTAYGNMSDEEFYKVMLSEFVAFGFGALFSKILKVNFNTEKQFNDLSNKYTQAVKDRTNHKR